MATSAGVALEDDVGALVDGDAVILVADGAVFDSKIGGRNIKSVAESQ
jgi:hypothetical protein